MKNKRNFNSFFVIGVVLLFIFAFISIGSSLSGNVVRSPSQKPQCNDKVDNDVDNKIDYGGFRSYPPDTDCSSPQDNTECTIACSSSSNCGPNGWGDGYCFNDDVYRDYTTYNCNEPETCGSYCTNNINPVLTQDCQATDPNGYCQSGQCYNTQSNNTIPDSCSDTDNGQTLEIKGVTSGYDSGFSYNKVDYCVTSTSVHEYWCSSTQNYEQTFNCPSGTSCTDGACVSTQTNTCSDTDGGFNAFVQGTISGLQNSVPYSFTDYCASSTSIHEYYCSVNTPQGFDQTCQGNTTNICSNGACAS